MAERTPRRIQRRRTRGWRLPEGAVYVGRPTIYGNPFRVHPTWGPEFCRTPDEAVADFRALMRVSLIRQAALAPLRGHDLACFCGLCPAHADGLSLGVACPDCPPCHADVLLTLANA